MPVLLAIAIGLGVAGDQIVLAQATELPWDQLLGPYGLTVGAVLVAVALGWLYRRSQAALLAVKDVQVTEEKLRTKEANDRAERWEKIATESSGATVDLTRSVNEASAAVKEMAGSVRELVVESRARTEAAIQRAAEVIVERVSASEDVITRKAPPTRRRGSR